MNTQGYLLRWNPWKQLEEFEEKNGDHVAMLNRLTGDHERDREANRLLRIHNRLVWMCMAFNAGHAQGAAGL